MKVEDNYVSGPYNLVRIEGSVENIKKVIYVFMDIHLDPKIQTECTDIRSHNIKNYLVDNFDTMKTIDNMEYDFFLETFPDYVTGKSKYMGNYLNQLRNLFGSIFSFNFKKNTVNKSPEFPNIRFHYIDIRSYLTFSGGDPFGIAADLYDYIMSLEGRLVYPNNIIKINDILNLLSARLNIIYDIINKKIKSSSNKKPYIITKNIEILSNYTDKQFIDIINYLINKITKEYQHKSIQTELNSLFMTQVKTLYSNYFDIEKEIRKYLDTIYPQVNHDIYEKITYNNKTSYFANIHKQLSEDIIYTLIKLITQLFEIAINIYVLIMDIYFLRRVLDKNYITNSIVYTGGEHSCNYIRMLLKHFNFTITHCFYSEYKIPQLIEKVKKTTKGSETLELFTPPLLSQCIETSKFPKNFY